MKSLLVISLGVFTIGCSKNDDSIEPENYVENIPNGFFEKWVEIPMTTIGGKKVIKDSLILWQESIANIVGRAMTGIGIVNKYTESDANGNAILLKRGDGVWATETRNSVFIQFDLKSKPKKVKGRYKFTGSNKAIDTLKIQVYFSDKSNVIPNSNLVSGFFPNDSREVSFTTPVDAFTDFEIDVSDFADKDYEVAHIQLLMKMGDLDLAEYGGEFSRAVIDDLKFSY